MSSAEENSFKAVASIASYACLKTAFESLSFFLTGLSKDELKPMSSYSLPNIKLPIPQNIGIQYL